MNGKAPRAWKARRAGWLVAGAAFQLQRLVSEYCAEVAVR